MNGVSIVICSYNGVHRLKSTLDHIMAQQLSSEIALEIVFVDNRSTDNTSSFVQEYFDQSKHNFKIQILHEKQPGKAYALELGYDSASFEYIITCDDDNWLKEDYVQRAFELMQQHPTIGLLGCKTIAIFEAEPPAWFHNYASAYVIGAQANAEGFFNGFQVWGAGMVFRKRLWKYLRKNGYEFTAGKDILKAVGEDTELSKIVKFLGYKFYYSQSMVLYHWMPTGRFSWTNSIAMFEGFGRTAVYLNFLGRIIKSNQKFINYNGIKLQLVGLHVTIMVSTIIKSFGSVLLPGRFSEGKKLAVKYAETKGFLKQILFDRKLKYKVDRMNSLINKLKAAEVNYGR